MNLLGFIIVTAVGYLLGAIPFAVIIAKSKGVDIFKVGSGNPGATNVKRSCGKFAGNLCFVLDALKGFVSAMFPVVATYFGIKLGDEATLAYLPYIGIVAAVVGHSFSPFIGFKGGKGVSTAIGGLLAVIWASILVALAVWLLIFYTTRYVSLASIAMAATLPVASACFYGNGLPLYISIALCLVVIIRHRSNIARLLKGTENRF